MKSYKHGKRVLGMALALAMVFAMSVVSLADNVSAAGTPTVTFTAEKAFAFTDKNDLFDNFKNMMPGDRVSQNIDVKSEASGRYDIYLYARDCELYKDAEADGGIHLETKENETSLLQYVTVTDAEGNVLDLVNAGVGTAGVKLGRFSKGDEIQLTVKVELPIELDNKYQDAEAYIDWIFYAEEYVEPDPGDGPSKTYTVTVNYYDTDGNVIRGSYQRTYNEGTNYDMSSRAYETITVGDTAYALVGMEGDPISGRVNEDKVIDLYYESTIVIPVNPTPGDEKPDLPDDEPGIPSIDIDEPPVPLDKLPETGDNGLILPAVVMVLSGSALAALLLFAPKKKNEAE